MDKEQITKILSKIKDTVGENNYKLALAITGHRAGKIKDIIMCNKDGELLLEYVKQLEQQCKKQKEVIDKAIKYIECNKYTIKHYEPYGTPTGLSNYETYNIKGYHQLLDILKEVSDE